MIQFKKIPLSKSVLLLLLFLTTNINGFLQENDSDRRTSKTDENTRDNRLSVDGPNGYFQNLPIRKMDVHIENYKKDRNTERLYDRRSFRTGAIRQNIEDRRLSNKDQLTRDIKTYARDINNNHRKFSRENVQNRRILNIHLFRDSRQPIRENNEHRITERASVSKINTSDGRRTLPDTDERRDTTQFTIRSETGQNRRLDARSISGERRNFRDTQLDRRTSDTSRQGTPTEEKQNFKVRSTRSLKSSDIFRTTEQLARRNSMESNILIERERQSTQDRDNEYLSRRSLLSTPSSRSAVDGRRSLPNRIRSTARDNLRTDSSRLTNRGSRATKERHSESPRSSMRHTESQDSSEGRNIRQTRLSDRFRSIERLVGDNSRSDSIRLMDRERRVIENQDASRRSLELRDRRVEIQSRLSDRHRTASPLVRDSSIADSTRIVNRDRRIAENRFSQDLSRRLDTRGLSRSAEVQDRTSASSEWRGVDQSRLTGRQGHSDRLVRSISRENPANIMERRYTSQRHFNHQGSSRRLLDSHRQNVPHLEILKQRSFEIRNLSENRSVKTLQRRENNNNKATDRQSNTEDSLEHQFTNYITRYVRELSRSDSTRKIRDIKVRDSRENTITRENADQRENIWTSRQIVNTRITSDNGRFVPSLASSGRYFERQISARAATKSHDHRDREITTLASERNAEDIKMVNDSNIWANTAKILLVAFLIGQIFVNTSKHGKFRFCNIMSVASIKQKTE